MLPVVVNRLIKVILIKKCKVLLKIREKEAMRISTLYRPPTFTFKESFVSCVLCTLKEVEEISYFFAWSLPINTEMPVVASQ